MNYFDKVKKRIEDSSNIKIENYEYAINYIIGDLSICSVFSNSDFRLRTDKDIRILFKNIRVPLDKEESTKVYILISERYQRQEKEKVERILAEL